MSSGYDEPEKTRGQKFKEGCSSFGKFLYNGENKTVMGRGGSSWAKIGVFYLILYAFLAGFFAAMLAVFMTTINPAGNIGKTNAGPKLTQYIENSPGLTLVREPIQPKDDFDRKTEIDAYKAAIDKYLNGFEDSQLIPECPISEESYATNGDVPCRFDKNLLGVCATNPDYGYARQTTNANGTAVSDMPCVFVKMNRVWGWVPEPDGNDAYLDLECKEEGGDATKIEVLPKGYLKSAFPFLGHKVGDKLYQYPAVAVRVKDTSAKILVQCELVGKGIKVSSSFNPQRSFGKIEFEVKPLAS